MNDSQITTRNRQAVLFGVLQLMVLAGLLAMTLQPDFKGGNMIVVILAGTMLLQVAVLISDVVFVKQPDSQPPPPPAPNNVKASSKGFAFLRILLMVMLLLIICYFMGVYAGFVSFLFVYWWRVARFSLFFSIILALLVGLALPVVFGSLVYVTMWPGIIPELIPGYLGGAISPPF
jgi:hypothetical protein